ncbi:MAG TPA: CoA transferase [Caulobacteraceae bacterium]|jgi:crotonobetainyl-CoA:carnitine CoA-transferase CaiB-like acyl-CoA transferase
MTSDSPPLAGLRVLDATSDVAGQFCGRLFADYGAEVILAEAAHGAPTRAAWPLDDDGGSFLFQHLNQGKHGHRLPADPNQALADLSALAQGADVVLIDRGRGDLRASLDEARQIVCVVSDFGEHGPYRDWRGAEIVHQALSGVMFVTGSEDREPLYGVGRRASYACGVTAYISCLAALIWRDRTGEGQAVEAVTAEATAAMAQNLVTQYSYTRSYPNRRLYAGMLAQLQCQDGWLVLFALRGWPAICRIFGIPDAATDPRFSDPVALRRNWPAAAAMLRRQAEGRLVEDLVEELQKAKVSSARMLSLPELLETDQYLARGFLRPDPASGALVSLGPVFRTTSPCRAEADAPALSDAPSVWRTAPGARRSTLPPVELPGRLPLQGLRVLDFTQAWAGPMTARALAFLGADVIKIENGERLDSWRGPATGMSDSASYPERQGGPRPYDRNALFNTQNHDKRAISLNLKDPRAQDIARRLASRSDVVLANFSPHALTKLGLGYEALSRDNPDLVMVEMPAYGNDGPWASHVGMGKTMEAAAGMSSLIGYDPSGYVLSGPAYLDPIGGLHGAAAVMTALAERGATGRGQYVEVAQVEAAMHWIGEFILAAGAGQAFPADANRRPDMAPHDAFPCMGEDQWMVIACPDDAAWARLARAVGVAELADPAYATLDGRRRARETLSALIGAWTRQRTKHEAADLLQAAGVPAAPVNSGADVYRDPFLRSRGFMHELTHPAAGVAEYPGLAYRLAGSPGAIRRPAPCFAEHTSEVLGGLLGMAATDIDRLVDEGVVLIQPAALTPAAAVREPA